MRIIGFSQNWPKLSKDEFTTFRFARRDKDWFVGERVQVFYKPRSKDRNFIGIAEIVNKEVRIFNFGSGSKPYIRADKEAIEDGFISIGDMLLWLTGVYGYRWRAESMNRLTLRWILTLEDGK